MEIESSSNNSHQTKVKTNCCKNVVDQVKISDRFESVNLDLNLWDVDLSFNVPILKVSVTTNSISQYYFGLSPPPLISTSLTILFDTFLI